MAINKLPIYFSDSQLEVIYQALDDMEFLNGQTHEYSGNMLRANEKAKSKIFIEIQMRKGKHQCINQKL